MGEKFDEGAGRAMATDTFTAIPAGVKHYACTSKETVVQINGERLFGIKHVAPADDPRKIKK